MSTDNVKIEVRNRSVEVKWVAQYCDHYMTNYIHEHANHDLSFQEISDMLRRATFKPHKGNIYHCFGITDGRKYLVVIILTSKFAVIKTCYRYGWK